MAAMLLAACGNHATGGDDDTAGPPGPEGPPAGAWLDTSAYLRTSGGVDVEQAVAAEGMGRYGAMNELTNCGGWTLTSYSSGTAFGRSVTPSGIGSTACTAALAVACCD